MHIARRGLILISSLALMGSLVACTTKKADEAAPTATTEVAASADKDAAEAAPPEADASDGDADVALPSDGETDESVDGDQARPATVPAECGWDSPAITGSGSEPTGMPADLQSALIGAWQHVSIDGDPVSKDIRYVFPEPGVMLYCQDVPGITDQAQTSAAITIEGTTIMPPSPHPGFEILAINDDAMLWKNNQLGDTYYLVRR